MAICWLYPNVLCGSWEKVEMFQSGSSSQPVGNAALEDGPEDSEALSAAFSAREAEGGKDVAVEEDCGVCLGACFWSSNNEGVELNWR
jgi:hypothetical protein